MLCQRRDSRENRMRWRARPRIVPQVGESRTRRHDHCIHDVSAKVQNDNVHVKNPALLPRDDAQRLEVEAALRGQHVLEDLRELEVEVLAAAALEILRRARGTADSSLTRGKQSR